LTSASLSVVSVVVVVLLGRPVGRHPLLEPLSVSVSLTAVVFVVVAPPGQLAGQNSL
jgi:hypothetical protein